MPHFVTGNPFDFGWNFPFAQLVGVLQVLHDGRVFASHIILEQVYNFYYSGSLFLFQSFGHELAFLSCHCHLQGFYAYNWLHLSKVAYDRQTALSFRVRVRLLHPNKNRWVPPLVIVSDRSLITLGAVGWRDLYYNNDADAYNDEVMLVFTLRNFANPTQAHPNRRNNRGTDQSDPCCLT